MRLLLFVRLLLVIVASASGLDRAAAQDTGDAAAQDMADAVGQRADDEASLGIGFDVFMQAYGFAAGRVGAPLDLRIISCKKGRCLWTVGKGVTLTTEHQQDRLDLHRIEAALDQRQSVDPNMRHRYEQVCLVIVGMVDRQASAAAQRAAATAISSPSDDKPRGFRLEHGERDVRIYGKPAVLGDEELRCGAVATAF